MSVRHPATHTVRFHKAKQFPKESTKAFAARVQGMAANCDLKVPCHACQVPVSYTEDTAYHVVIAGLTDRNLQQLCTAQAFLNNKNINHLFEFCNAYENGSGCPQVHPLEGQEVLRTKPHHM